MRQDARLGRLSVVAVVLLAAAAVAGTGERVQAAPVAVHFTAAGDYDATPDTHTVLSGLAAAAPDAHIALGDLAYGSFPEEQQWCDYVKARVGEGFPFELLAGNHESDGTLDGDINDFSACLPNQLPGVVGTYGRQWYVDLPKNDPTVRFVMISPGLTFPDGLWSYAAGTPRHAWTSAAIDGARAKGVPWVVVGVHKPCLTIGRYACDGQNDIMNLLISKKVDLVLNGHEHMYQRTKQLALGAGCPAVPVNTYQAACVADADDDLVRGAGTVMATVGTGGTPLRDVTTTDAEAGYFTRWSGLNAEPTFGFLDVQADATTLTARFKPTRGTFTDSFVIRPAGDPPPNTAPTAVIGTPSCTVLTCRLDGSGSTDADGTVSRYAWDLGDGTSLTGSAPTHTYAAAGTYAVTLVVTDDRGATASTTRQLTVTAPPPAAQLAADSFSRNVSGAWGAADTGGSWAVNGSTANVAVTGGVGQLVMRTPGAGQLAALPTSTSTARADLTLTMGTDKAGTGGGSYVSVIPRRVAGAGDYRAKVRVLPPNVVRVSLDRTGPTGAETVVVPAAAVPGLAYAPGDRLRVRVQAVGTSPTVLRAKVWRAGTPEPAAWLVSAGDATAALQAAGGIGVQTYLSSSATNAPVTLSVDDVGLVAVP
ncbi:MAG TPA: PKD domain-containing protein [Actinomycetales bacterium]|jgi:hypothetical protein